MKCWEHLNFSRIMVMAAGFFMMQNAVNVLQNITPVILEQADFGNLGFYASSSVFLTMGFASFSAAPQLRYFGYKYTMVIGICTYLIYTSCQLLALYYASGKLQELKSMIYGLNITFAFLNGWGNALLFVCASSYVNDAANEHNKGMYNSILWIANCGSFVTGNLMAAFVVPALGNIVYFWMCLGLLVVTLCFFFLLKNPLPQPEEDLDES